jgi:selenide,water dikinase
LKEKEIKFVPNRTVKEVTPNSVILDNGDVISCDVAVWATGAEPQKVSAESDLDLMKGFFRVNKYLQSTSHPNVFAGGDCITMEDYADKPYPTKAGVYAVRAGPFIAQNLINYAENKELVEYVP